MTTDVVHQGASATRLLSVALVGGSLAGLVAASFIWIVEEGIHLVWVELPERLGVDPFDSWWLFAVPIVAGLFIGLGQQYVGNLPLPIAEVVRRFRRGDGVEPALVPGAFALATLAIVGGGALGFEAALSCIVGGFATGISRRLGPLGPDARAAWGFGSTAGATGRVRSIAGWIAALAGLFAYRWAPFGGVDLGFRFDGPDGVPAITDGVLIALLGAVVAIPAAWALATVVRAEHADLLRRNPIAFGVGGGLVLAVLATVDPLVLFSGQEGIASLDTTATGDLLYVAVAKWLALCTVMLAGWRGGPIFPLWLSFAAIATVLSDPLGVPADLAGVAGVTAVSAVFLRGRIVVAVVLTLYAVPVSYGGTMLLAAAGTAIALAVADDLGILPPAPDGTDD